MTGTASEPSDEHLMQAFAAGDARAFETLYDRHALPVWRFVRRSLPDASVADDLVQDVWFTLVRHAPQYEPRAKFRTWLFTLAHHRMVDHWRTHKAHTSLDADTDEGASLADTLAADSGFGPVRQLQTREQAQALLDALAALPLPQREAFLPRTPTLAEAGVKGVEMSAWYGIYMPTATPKAVQDRVQATF